MPFSDCIIEVVKTSYDLFEISTPIMVFVSAIFMIPSSKVTSYLIYYEYSPTDLSISYGNGF